MGKPVKFELSPYLQTLNSGNTSFLRFGYKWLAEPPIRAEMACKVRRPFQTFCVMPCSRGLLKQNCRILAPEALAPSGCIFANI